MQAILRGAGDSFHPRLQSSDLAVVRPDPRLAQLGRHQAHVGHAFEKVARQNLNRNWQNGRLWWNDSGRRRACAATLPVNEFRFHATAIYASGGMVLSGDDLTQIPPDRLAMLKKLLPPTKTAAAFEDSSLCTVSST